MESDTLATLLFVFLRCQGRAILSELAALPSRNVSVRVLTSVPSVPTNSTDLKILKENGEEVFLCSSAALAAFSPQFWVYFGL